MECDFTSPNCSSVLLLFSSLLMELAALSSKGICIDDGNYASTELCQTGYEILLDTKITCYPFISLISLTSEICMFYRKHFWVDFHYKTLSCKHFPSIHDQLYLCDNLFENLYYRPLLEKSAFAITI